MKTVLIVGLGDIGTRVAALLPRSYRVFALVRKADAARAARKMGVVPIRGDLDHPHRLQAIAAARFDWIFHFAPPAPSGRHDLRTANLLAALGVGRRPRPAGGAMRLVYVSTTGVYGDCVGAWIDESRRVRPQTARARRRVDAERRILALSRHPGWRSSVLRAPGIVSDSRLPRDRLLRRTPALRPEDDVYVNHIHAADLAHAAVAAARRARRGRVFNAVSDEPVRMGDYFDAVADALGLDRPPRITRETASASLPAVLLSFMQESRRIANTRLRRELRLDLDFPTLEDLLAEVRRHAPAEDHFSRRNSPSRIRPRARGARREAS